MQSVDIILIPHVFELSVLFYGPFLQILDVRVNCSISGRGISPQKPDHKKDSQI